MTPCQELKKPQLYKAAIQTSSVPISWAYHDVAITSLRKHQAFIFNSAAHFSISTFQLCQPMCDPVGCWQLSYTAENLFHRDWNFPLISLAISDKHEMMPVDIWRQTTQNLFRNSLIKPWFLAILYTKGTFLFCFSCKNKKKTHCHFHITMPSYFSFETSRMVNSNKHQQIPKYTFSEWVRCGWH